MLPLNPRAFILNTDLAQAAGQWRLFSDVAMQYISDAASYGVLGCYWRPIFSMTGKTRLVCGALCWSVISIADAGFCRRQFQQTQGSPVSTAWLKCNSCAWEILESIIMLQHSKSLFFAQVCCNTSCTGSCALFINTHKGLTHMCFSLAAQPKIVSKLPTAIISCKIFNIKNLCVNVKLEEAERDKGKKKSFLDAWKQKHCWNLYHSHNHKHNCSHNSNCVHKTIISIILITNIIIRIITIGLYSWLCNPAEVTVLPQTTSVVLINFKINMWSIKLPRIHYCRQQWEAYS